MYQICRKNLRAGLEGKRTSPDVQYLSLSNVGDPLWVPAEEADVYDLPQAATLRLALIAGSLATGRASKYEYHLTARE